MRAAEARTCLPQPSFGLYRTRISRPPTEPSPGEGMCVSRYAACLPPIKGYLVGGEVALRPGRGRRNKGGGGTRRGGVGTTAELVGTPFGCFGGGHVMYRTIL